MSKKLLIPAFIIVLVGAGIIYWFNRSAKPVENGDDSLFAQTKTVTISDTFTLTIPESYESTIDIKSTDLVDKKTVMIYDTKASQIKIDVEKQKKEIQNTGGLQDSDTIVSKDEFVSIGKVGDLDLSRVKLDYKTSDHFYFTVVKASRLAQDNQYSSNLVIFNNESDSTTFKVSYEISSKAETNQVKRFDRILLSLKRI
jgi:hypothetical protein